jgi:hypothetical protein
VTPAEEYAAALAAYTAAKARLIEAKRHYDHKNAPEVVAARNAKAAEYRAKKRAAWNAPEAVAERERYAQENRERMDRWLEEREARYRRTG